MKNLDKMGINTKVVHAGQKADPATGAVSVPIYQSSTFKFKDADHGAACFSGESNGYKYTRLGNPTNAALEESIAILEGGCGAVAAATGMAAVNAVYLTMLSSGDHIVATDALYGPSRMILENEYSRYGVEATFVDSTNPQNVADAIQPNTKLVFIESPANPTLSLTDIEACAKIAHDAGAKLAIDNTFATPLLQQPLSLGADIVVHSMTKFINGHTDVVAGIVVVKDPAILKRMKQVHYNFGGTMDPHQAWLVLRGVRTLSLRVEKAQKNSLEICEFLLNHPKVEWVRYPGHPSHPQYELAQKQMSGGGAVMSFGVKGGLEAGKTVINNMQIPHLAVSLGGIESLIEHPASMTHTGIPKAERELAGITDDLVRVAVGCEDAKDLIDDLSQALDLI